VRAPASVHAFVAKLRSAWTSLGRAGARGLAARLATVLLRPLGAWHTLLFFAVAFDEPIPEIKPRMTLEMHVVRPAELAAYRTAFEASGADWRIEDRAAPADLCTLALSEGRLVHLRWMTAGPRAIPDLPLLVVPQPGEAYVHSAFTPAWARGLHVQPAVSSFMMNWGRARGYHRHVFYVRADNASGLRIVAKIGARRTRVVRGLRLRGNHGCWVLGLGRGSPRLELAPGAVARRLGPLGWWVRERIYSPASAGLPPEASS
jgi:hypothetical protein